MTVSQPVKRVVDLLTGAGYRKLDLPLTIASIPFEFDSLLLGADRALDLIVVIDTLIEPEQRLRQKVEGLSRALDQVASRRPLTVVLVGPLPRATIAEALAKVCRVLAVGTPTGETADRYLNDALAVLLPLDLPNATEAVLDPLGEVRRYLASSQADESLTPLFAASLHGEDTVREALRIALLEPLAKLDSP